MHRSAAPTNFNNPQPGASSHNHNLHWAKPPEMPTAGWWKPVARPCRGVAAVGIKPGMAVIDLCSGDGWFTLQIAKIARRVVAIDLIPDLLDVARHRLTESGATNCDFVQGDAYDLAELVPGPG